MTLGKTYAQLLAYSSVKGINTLQVFTLHPMRPFTTLLLAFLFLLPAAMVGQSPTQPDSSWAVDGVLANPACNAVSEYHHSHLYLGYYDPSGNTVVTRYTDNGIPDPTFGFNGTTAFGQTGLRDLQGAPDGKLYALGQSTAAYLLRLHPDGTLDNSFQAALPPGMNVRSVACSQDGRIWIGGAGANGACVAVCLLPDGQLDSSFAGSGGYEVLYPNIMDQAFIQVIVLANQNILLLADIWDYDFCGWIRNNSLSLLRPDGAVVSHDAFYSEENTVLDLLPMPDGGFVMAREHGLYRFDQHGAVDATFGNGGFVREDSATIVSHALLQDPNGALLSVKSYRNAIGQFIGNRLQRYNADGSADTAFGPGGVVAFTTTHERYDLSAYLQADGKLLVAGSDYHVQHLPCNGFSVAVSRYAGYHDASVSVAPPAPVPATFSLRPYPNPGTAAELRLHIDSPKAGTLSLTCLDLQGRQVLPAIPLRIPAGQLDDLVLPLPEGISPGIYFLRAEGMGEAQTFKLVLQ